MKNLNRFAQSIVRNRGSYADAHNSNMIDDIVSDGVYTAFLKGIPPDDDKVKGYVFYATLQHLQKRGKASTRQIVYQPLEYASRVSDGSTPPLVALVAKETLQEMLVAVERLSPYLRSVATHYLTGLDALESAKILGVKPQTVRGDRCRVVFALRERMGVVV